MTMKFHFIAAALTVALAASPASAANCGDSAKGFDAFKRDFAREAKAAGIGKRGMAALASAQYSAETIKYDRRVNRALKSGNTNFAKFYAKKTKGLKGPAQSRLKQHGKLLRQIEERYGVQKEVLVTIWGMETGFGGYTGNADVLDSVASLTYDCRRSGFFKPHLMATLQILDQGWISRQRLRGARHGEIGQTQFMASSYVNYGIDFDGGGRDLIGSPADALASTANYLRAHGWQAGQSYQPGTHNFSVLHEWNASTAYQRSIAEFASSL